MRGMGSARGFWSLIARDEQRDLLAVGRDKKYPPGAILCFQGEPATHVFILLSGWVKILAVTEDGHENVLELRGDGELVEEGERVTGIGHRADRACGKSGADDGSRAVRPVRRVRPAMRVRINDLLPREESPVAS